MILLIVLELQYLNQQQEQPFLTDRCSSHLIRQLEISKVREVAHVTRDRTYDHTHDCVIDVLSTLNLTVYSSLVTDTE